MPAEKIDIIAANPGFELLEYFHNEGGEDACVSRSPIVAWKVTNGEYAEAIAVEGPTRNSEAVVKYPDGRVTMPECQTWDDEASWLADARIRGDRAMKKAG